MQSENRLLLQRDFRIGFGFKEMKERPQLHGGNSQRRLDESDSAHVIKKGTKEDIKMMKNQRRTLEASDFKLAVSQTSDLKGSSSFATQRRVLVGRLYLDVLAEEVGVETQPVSGDVEAALQKDVSEKSTGVN